MKKTYTIHPGPKKFDEALHAAPPLFMFTMGKVGSKSIGQSLELFYPGVIVHGHVLNLKGRCKPGEIGPDHEDARFRKVWDWCVTKRNAARVISPVRESAARNISTFFYNFNQITKRPEPIESLSFAEQNRLFQAYRNHLNHTRWFDEQLRPLTDWNVYSEPYHEQCIFGEKDNWEILVLKTELPDYLKESHLCGFLNLEKVKLTNRNTAEERPYAQSYTKFKAEFDWQRYRRHICVTRYYQYFYSSVCPVNSQKKS
jgi:hypothetical protein